jgi:hypothetical protein
MAAPFGHVSGMRKNKRADPNASVWPFATTVPNGTETVVKTAATGRLAGKPSTVMYMGDPSPTWLLLKLTRGWEVVELATTGRLARLMLGWNV